MKLFPILTFALAGIIRADVGPRKTGKAFVPRQPLEKPLSVRGGAGPLDPSHVAKGATAFGLTAHSLHWLVPEKALEAFGVSNPTQEHIFIAQREYAILVSAILSGYLRLFHQTGVNKAIGFGTFPFIIDVVRSVLNDDEKKIGISNLGQVVTVLLPLVILAYVCLNDLDVANTVMKVYGVYNMIKAALYMLSPKELGKAWGFKDDSADKELLIGTCRWIGVALFSYGMIIFASAQKSMSLLKLIGYGWIPSMLKIFSELFVTGEVDKYGLNKPLYMSWLLVGTLVIGTLAI